MPQSSQNNLFQLAIDNLSEIFNADYQADLEKIFPNFSRDCGNLSVEYIYKYLTSPFENQQPISIDRDDLKSALNIAKDYEKFYAYMLDVLVDESLLTIKDNNLYFKTKPKATVTLSTLKDKFPMFGGTLALLEHCVSYYPKALSELIPPISVLYPNGNVAFLEEILSKNTSDYSEMPTLRGVTVKVISNISQKFPLNILEVGGGRGIITRELISNINIKNISEYCFTDIGRRFIIDMDKYSKNSNLSFVKCNTFDITKNPVDQGIANTYDIVLGLDVVHATPNVVDTLKILKSLINANGILCLLETTHVGPWQNLIMGLTKGWWIFNDTRKYSPLMDVNEWKEALYNSGFTSVSISTLQNKNSDSALIIAS
jgi:2-polyprenyl-3-methyl-5-hydroxy-6-metoxy-1,4-benzoquinol methylase